MRRSSHSLILSGTLVLSAMMSCTVDAEEQVGNDPELGYQLYTIRDQLTDSTAIYHTLAKTHAMGLNLAETFGWRSSDNTVLGLEGTTWKALLAANGQHSISGHYVPSEFEQNEVVPIDTSVIPGLLDVAQSMGQKWVILPWMTPVWRTDSGAQEIVKYMKALGRQANARGMRAAYHNHDFEFTTTMSNGIPLYAYLLDQLPQELVDFQMDLYWTSLAGEDPLTWFAQHPGRFVLWHVKDMDPQDSTLQVPVGQGQIDWPRIFAAREQAGMLHYFLEQDECQIGKSSMECLEASSNYGKAVLNPALDVESE